jgi:hypothetical protein
MVSIFGPLFYFLVLALCFCDNLAEVANRFPIHNLYNLDSCIGCLVIIPFSKLRVNQKPMVYAAIKIGSVG